MPRRAGRGVAGAGIALALMTAGAVGVGAATWAGVGSGFGSQGGYLPTPGPTVSGTVASLTTSPSDTITLTTKNGTTWTVDVSASTTYADSTVTTPTFADVAVGDELLVYGTTTATDTVSATNVTIVVKPAVVGTVATVTPGGDTFTLAACKGDTWTVTVTGSTAYTERGVTSPTFADVVVSDEAVVYGTSTGTDAVAASTVVIIQRPIVTGTVASVTTSPSDSFTVMAKRSQTWTVTVTGSTTYSERNVTSPGFANVAVGDGVVVYGTSTGTDSATAISVAIMQRPVVVGTVASVTTSPSDSFTVAAWKQQTVTVDVTGSTTYTERGVTSASFSNVAVGDQVAVYGTSAGTSTFDAVSVAITQRPAVTGKVAAVTTSPSDSFTLTARGGQTWTVNVSATTTYSECGVSSPSFSTLAVGNEVAVYGTSTGSNTVDATSVVILSQPSPHPKASPWAVGQEPSGTPGPSGFHVASGVTTVQATGGSGRTGQPGGPSSGFGSGGSKGSSGSGGSRH
jgi:hypothetical protein